MKKIASALVALTLVGCGVTPSQLDAPKSLKTGMSLQEFRADGISKKRVMVSFRTKNVDLKSFAARQHVVVEKYLKGISSAILTIPAGSASEDLLARLKSDKTVASAEADRFVKLDDVTVNDPQRAKQYALDKVMANQAWEKNQGEEIKIAIVDSGVDMTHPDLAEKLLTGVNTVEERNPPKDDVGHGTHVAGIAAAIANNGVGIAGMAPKAKIIPVKVLGASSGSAASIAAGIIWAADQGADVMNMSLGMYETSEVVEKAVRYAIDEKNVVIVATMGNDNIERKRYPAAYPGVIAVGSTDAKDLKSTFSNFGDWIAVSAPGTAILSTFPTYPVSISGTQGYTSLSGTSMAAPLVAGLAALIRGQKKGATPAQVKKILQDSADDLGTPGFDKQFGFGRVNALKALSL
ncbi:MAG TPA: hypothetical protein DD435_00595 [Cyanobacteria bacterium UBA8530]|nr:hypothetical protein [Cyanobacteria bacterium UBA8530]